MAGAQLRLPPSYLRAPLTPAAWVFAFAAAVTAADDLRWTSAAHDASRWPTWTVLAAASALAGWIAAPTAAALIAVTLMRPPATPDATSESTRHGPRSGHSPRQNRPRRREAGSTPAAVTQQARTHATPPP